MTAMRRTFRNRGWPWWVWRAIARRRGMSGETIFEGLTEGSADGVVSGETPDGSLPDGWTLNALTSDDAGAEASVTAATQVVDGVECIELTVVSTETAYLEFGFAEVPASEGETWKVGVYVKSSDDLTDPFLDLSDGSLLDENTDAIPTTGSFSASLREAEGVVTAEGTAVNAVAGMTFPAGTTTLLIAAKLEQVS